MLEEKMLEPGLETELEDRLYSSGEAIQFSPICFLRLFESSRLRHISELLSKSQYGIRFYDEGLYDELLEMMKAFDSSTHTSRLIILSPDYRPVCVHLQENASSCRQQLITMPTGNPSLRSLWAGVAPILYNNFREKVIC